MLRMYVAEQCSSLLAKVLSRDLRQRLRGNFVSGDLNWGAAPDAIMLTMFRHILEPHELNLRFINHFNKVSLQPAAAQCSIFGVSSYTGARSARGRTPLP